MTRNLLKWPSEVKTKQGLVACPKEIVTVVVTCHNQGHFLRESIGSILSQTRLPDEILIVDDGSSDNTRDEARRFPEVIYIRQDNSGLAAARNTGLSRSRGDLLVFLDADDRLLPHALEAGLDDFAAHPECAFVFGAFRKIDATGKPLGERAPMRPLGEDAYLGLLRNNQICMHATAMFRRRALEAVGGYDTSLPACEDYDLYLKIARRFPAHQHARLVAEYRMHPGQMSARLSMMLKTAKRVLLAQRKFVQKNAIYARAIKTGIKNFEECYGQLDAGPSQGGLADGPEERGVDRIMAITSRHRVSIKILEPDTQIRSAPAACATSSVACFPLGRRGLGISAG